MTKVSALSPIQLRNALHDTTISVKRGRHCTLNHEGEKIKTTLSKLASSLASFKEKTNEKDLSDLKFKVLTLDMEGKAKLKNAHWTHRLEGKIRRLGQNENRHANKIFSIDQVKTPLSNEGEDLINHFYSIESQLDSPATSPWSEQRHYARHCDFLVTFFSKTNNKKDFAAKTNKATAFKDLANEATKLKDNKFLHTYEVDLQKTRKSIYALSLEQRKLIYLEIGKKYPMSAWDLIEKDIGFGSIEHKLEFSLQIKDLNKLVKRTMQQEKLY